METWTIYEVNVDGSNCEDTAEEVALPSEPTGTEVARMMEDGTDFEVHQKRPGLFEIWTREDGPNGDWSLYLSHRVERGEPEWRRAS